MKARSKKERRNRAAEGWRIRHRAFAAALLAALTAAPECAAAAGTCNRSNLFSSRLLTDICYECIFPVKIASARVGKGTIPKASAQNPMCVCPGAFGIPSPGVTVGMWNPARLIEFTRDPGCSPVLNGAVLPSRNRADLGTHGEGVNDAGDLAFYNYHYFSFPLLSMLDLGFLTRCASGDYSSMDLMYLSELDPTWKKEKLAALTAPESALFANAPAVASCAADAAASQTGEPLDAMFWCLGAWGTMYPLAGYTLASGSINENTSELTGRVIMALHRRGLAVRTMGSGSLCAWHPEPFMPKSMYRYSMIFPRPESRSNHGTGVSTMLTGGDRQIPGTGEDPVYLIWRFEECCQTAW